MRGASRLGVIVVVAVLLVIGIGVLLRRVNADRARHRVTEDAAVAAPTAAPGAPQARRTPTWRADLNDPEPSEDLAYRSDPAAPVVVDDADQWAKIDFDEIKRALPDSTYWKMAFPTSDKALIEERERIREQWNAEYGKVVSNTATDEEIDAYYGEQQKLSEDYLEFLVYLAEHYGDLVPRSMVGALKLAGEMHLARLEEIPRKIAEAKERHAAHERERQAWLEEQKQFATPAPPTQ